MNPGPLEIIGNPLTPEWVKQALKAAVQQDTLDGIYWANVILMALRREVNEKAMDLASAKLNQTAAGEAGRPQRKR